MGGAHGWLYQVYRRWPGDVLAMTGTVSGNAALAASRFDESPQGALAIQRVLPPAPEIGLASPGYWRAMVGQIRLIRSVVNAERFRMHVVRAFPEGISALGAKALSLGAGTLITYAHGEEMSIARSSRQLLAACRLVYRKSDLVVANSRNTKRLVKELAPGAQVVCIHPGVDVRAISPDPRAAERFRSSLPWSAETLVLCTVARMEARKNQASVITAISRLRREGKSVAYICAGDGPEGANLRAQAVREGVSDHVVFPGEVPDAERNAIINGCDVCIMPSIRAGNVFEGFGMLFLEAAAAGRPSIAGNSGGQPEAVLHEETGLVVDGRSVDEICSAIARMMDPATRAAMGVRARKWALENDWDLVAKRTFAAVEDLSGTGTAAK